MLSGAVCDAGVTPWIQGQGARVKVSGRVEKGGGVRRGEAETKGGTEREGKERMEKEQEGVGVGGGSKEGGNNQG